MVKSKSSLVIEDCKKQNNLLYIKFIIAIIFSIVIIISLNNLDNSRQDCKCALNLPSIA